MPKKESIAMREKALVIANRGTQAKVKIIRSEACNKCGACSSDKDIKVWAKNPLNARVGQSVEIEINPTTFLSAAMITYGMPLVAFVIGVILAYTVGMFLSISITEPIALLAGLLTMGISVVIIYFINKKAEESQRFYSNIVKIIE